MEGGGIENDIRGYKQKMHVILYWKTWLTTVAAVFWRCEVGGGRVGEEAALDKLHFGQDRGLIR